MKASDALLGPQMGDWNKLHPERTRTSAVWLAEFVEELHPRDEMGRFGIKDQPEPTREERPTGDPAEMARVAEELSTARDFGDADPAQPDMPFHMGERSARWGKTDDMAAAEDAHYAAEKALGRDVIDAVDAWSWGAGIEEWRGAYERYQETGSTDAEHVGADIVFGDIVNDGAQTVFEMIDANTVDADLYRGQTIPDDSAIAALRPGDVIPDGIASWSRDPEVADVFRDYAASYTTARVTTEAAQIELHLQPGAHGVDIAAVGSTEYAWQEEVIVGGEHEVVSIEKTDGLYGMPLYSIELRAVT